MIQQINPSSIKGSILAPASKSVVQRALAASLLCTGKSILNGYTPCDDSSIALQIIKNLGAAIVQNGRELIIEGCLPIFQPPIARKINCGESGLSSRLFAPVSLLFGNNIEISGEGSLLNRQFTNMEHPFKQLGVQCKTNKGYLPLHLSGQLKAGHINVDGSSGSQFLSGLLMTLPLLDGDSVIEVKNLQSKPYIDLTIDVLRAFCINIENQNYEVFNIRGNQQYQANQYTIEGDWSGASCLLVAGTIAGSIEISGLNNTSKQADKILINVLKSAGAVVEIKENLVAVNKSNLNAFDFDATHCPDLFPALAVLAANCNGTSSIQGINRLVNKESNRALTLKTELTNIGIKVEIEDNKILIHGGQIQGGNVDAHNDHRIAMAMAVAGLNAKSPVIINGAECVNKSYPDFFEDLKSLQKL